MTFKNNLEPYCKISYVTFGSVSLPPTDGKIMHLLLEKFFTSNILRIMSLVFKRFFIFSRAMFNSALRNVFLSIVSVSKEVGGSEFTVLSSEFESFKILVNCKWVVFLFANNKSQCIGHYTFHLGKVLEEVKLVQRG